MEKRMNVGYEIIEATAIDNNREIVIGHNPKTDFYVCWYYRKDNNDYYWGNYSESYEAVKENYNERIKENLKIY